MLKRNEKGKLQLRTLDAQVFFDGLFMECKTESEVEWLMGNLIPMIEISSEDVINSFEEMADE